MAEFSTQYCEIHDMGFEGDFDIEKEAETIPPGHYKPMICEGFGFTAISKEQDGTTMLYFPDYDDESRDHWIEYKTFIQQQQNKQL